MFYFEGAQSGSPITTKMGPLATQAAVDPISGCATVECRKNNDHQWSIKQKLRGKNAIKYKLRVVDITCDITNSTLHRHHREPIRILKGKFRSAF